MIAVAGSDPTTHERAARLHRLLGGDALAQLRRRLRARYARGDTREAFTLGALSDVERRALERLLGRSVRAAASMRLRRSELDAAVLRAGLAANFHAALEALDGPLIDRQAERTEHAHAWRALVAGVRDARLRAALADAAGLGVVKRLCGGDAARGEALLDRAERVLARLPARGVPLARVAADALGDAHALDAGQPVAALVLRACRSDADTPREPGAFGRAASDTAGRESESRRAQWARVGVTLNELAAPVLVLGLRARGTAPLARLASAAAALGSPTHLNLRALLQGAPDWEVGGGVVHVCENPSLVALAADALGAHHRPLVCTDGMPAAAQQTLLRQLAEAGATLRYHGDFDWPGVAIGNFVVHRFAAQPWRFSAADYLAADVDVELPLTEGRRVEARWDARLAGAMARRGVAVHEERVADGLLADLAS